MPPKRTEVPEGIETIDVWRCPACGMRMSGRSYSLDETRSKCSKSKHRALSVASPYIAVADLPALYDHWLSQLSESLLGDEAVELVAKWLYRRSNPFGYGWQELPEFKQRSWRQEAGKLLAALQAVTGKEGDRG
jgi:hypothetical protein